MRPKGDKRSGYQWLDYTICCRVLSGNMQFYFEIIHSTVHPAHNSCRSLPRPLRYLYPAATRRQRDPEKPVAGSDSAPDLSRVRI